MTHRPVVLFESWRSLQRDALISFMKEKSYEVCQLPLLANSPPQVMAAEQFASASEINFAGIPNEFLTNWPPKF